MTSYKFPALPQAKRAFAEVSPSRAEPVAILGIAPTRFASARAQLARRRVQRTAAAEREVLAFRVLKRLDLDGHLVEPAIGLPLTAQIAGR
ncbi:hypothetical protein [Nocardia sp. NPDC048505]|uniref:hypothetical protein n=1 Tax=unclassified Nocardia TaxID=2637762 RepID=UPI0033C0D97F